MSDFRLGDRTVIIAGQSTRLRLSVSALAEMADGLAVGSPTQMAEKLRQASLSDWNVMVSAMAHPCPVEALSRDQLSSLLPVLSLMVAESLTP